RRSKFRFYCVVTRSMPHMIRRRFGHPSNVHLDAAELRERRLLHRIVRQQILRAQFVTDLVKRLIELRGRSRVVELPSRVFGELNERVLSSRFASRAALNGN